MAFSAADEPPLDPACPIIDPHMHLWDIRSTPGSVLAAQRFLFDEFEETLSHSRHNITHTVFVECHSMYRRDGAPEFRPIGETEFATGVAAMSASGLYSACKVAHRIVGSANLSLGAGVRPVLEAHKSIAGERFRGVRMPTAFSEAGMFGRPPDPARRHILSSTKFREGAGVLAEMDLSLDVWCFHTQLDELAELADSLPDLPIILDHIGTPELLGAFSGREIEMRVVWTEALRRLARRPNVVIKLGGMGMNISGQIGGAAGRQNSQALAQKWRPYIEICIEAFGPTRCMFESNFPPDYDAGSYGAIWNAFKIAAMSYNQEERDFLFRRTAANAYRIALDGQTDSLETKLTDL